MPTQRRSRRGRAFRAGHPGYPSYPPPQLPIHPQLAAKRRKRPLLPLLLAGLIVVASAIVIAVTTRHHTSALDAKAYTPQVDRNFEYVGNPDGQLSSDAIDKIAQNNSLEILPKFDANFNLTQHFDDARRIVDAGKQYGTNTKVFDYFSASYWFTANEQAWGSYAEGFQQSWLLRDSQGTTIPYVGDSGAKGTAPPQVLGYVLDLSNPAYRAWAVATIVSWMKAAPYSGITFDAAAPMQGSGASKYIADGATTYNTLLCGSAYSLDAQNCDRVQQWNNGLVDLLSQTTQALGKMGDQVQYNGIAPSALRGQTRNVGLAPYANIALNEGFCFAVSVSNPDRLNFNSVAADAALMRQFAAAHRTINEVTNVYQSAEKQRYGDYCVGSFLIGWQPDYSYYCYHSGYSYPPTGKYPAVAEQNLSLGKPLTVDYQNDNGALTRTFQNGFVAVNDSEHSVTITVPEAVVSFADGNAGNHYASGDTVTLAAHGALLSLTQRFLGVSSTQSN